MIIRYTVYDNDLINDIKDFYKHIKYDNDLWIKNKDINYDDYTDLKKAISNLQDFNKLLKKYLYEKENMTKDEIYALNFLLKCKFNFYLHQIGKKSLINKGNVEIINVIYDKNYNGEYVYYFVETDQIVIL